MGEQGGTYRGGTTAIMTSVSCHEVMKSNTIEKMTWSPNRRNMDTLDVQAFWITATTPRAPRPGELTLNPPPNPASGPYLWYRKRVCSSTPLSTPRAPAPP
jgi:hypothetical protein